MMNIKYCCLVNGFNGIFFMDKLWILFYVIFCLLLYEIYVIVSYFIVFFFFRFYLLWFVEMKEFVLC